MYKVMGADGREYGPASADEVRQWLAQGRIHYQTLVRGPAEAAWRPLHTFSELTPPPPLGAGTTPAGRNYKNNPLALWGFICGVLSFLGTCFCCCGCPVNFLAILLSALGLAQARRERDEASKTLAIVGLVLGILTILMSTLTGVIAAITQAVIHATS